MQDKISMSFSPDVLWIDVSPNLQGFNRPLIDTLCQKFAVVEWQYCQTIDEPISLEVALNLLHDHLQNWKQPLHLLGHGTGGLLSLLYARRYPERVRSLTLLSVGASPAFDWQAHYYTLLNVVPCSRECLLKHMVYILMGHQSPSVAKQFIKVLDRDLKNSLSPNNLYQNLSLFPGGVPTPLFVCSGAEDPVVNTHLLEGWRPWLKPSDWLWQCPDGSYFFHYFYPQLVGEKVTEFWHSLEKVNRRVKAV